MRGRAWLRGVARAVQSVAAKVANPPPMTPGLAGITTHDLLKAHRLAKSLRAGDRVLDVGCGCGDRLVHLTLFQEQLDTHGVDLAVGQPTLFGGVHAPRLSTFDGQRLPFDDRSFDVVMLCYVLHHLGPREMHAMLEEATRCARRAVLLLEDSVAAWSPFQDLRNAMHIVDTDLEYAASPSYQRRGAIDSFLTRTEWTTLLRRLPRVTDARHVSLDDISTYRHHAMFVAELGG